MIIEDFTHIQNISIDEMQEKLCLPSSFECDKTCAHISVNKKTFGLIFQFGHMLGVHISTICASKVLKMRRTHILNTLNGLIIPVLLFICAETICSFGTQ